MSDPRAVIIFGPTGGVGSVAALTAHRQGAKVSPAMRDPSKPTPKLDSINAEKVQADLTQPESVKAAVRQTGAKTAFIYAAFGVEDHMRATIQALKDGGAESVVFLSSFTVQKDIREVPATDFIAYLHAQVEVSLDEVFGPGNYVALRPAYFASNSSRFKAGVLRGEVKYANPEAEFDWISPEDIGRVAGHILAKGSQEQVVMLVGPEKLSVRNVIGLLGSTLGKEVKVTRVSKEEDVENLVQDGIPVPLAEWLANDVTEHPGETFKAAGYSAGVVNIQKYTGQAPVSFKKWLEDNKKAFEA